MAQNGERCNWCKRERVHLAPPLARIRETAYVKGKKVVRVTDLCPECKQAYDGMIEVLKLGALEFHTAERQRDEVRSRDLPMVA
jgi:hypothetical protein